MNVFHLDLGHVSERAANLQMRRRMRVWRSPQVIIAEHPLIAGCVELILKAGGADLDTRPFGSLLSIESNRQPEKVSARQSKRICWSRPTAKNWVWSLTVGQAHGAAWIKNRRMQKKADKLSKSGECALVAS